MAVTNLGDMVLFFSTAGPRPATIMNKFSPTRADLSVWTKIDLETAQELLAGTGKELVYLENVQRGAFVGQWLESTDDND